MTHGAVDGRREAQEGRRERGGSGPSGFRGFCAVAQGLFLRLPFPPRLRPHRPPSSPRRATKPRGRVLPCQTRPRRVYNSPAVAPGAAAVPALRPDWGRAPRTDRPSAAGPSHALAHTHAATHTRAHTPRLSPEGSRPSTCAPARTRAPPRAPRPARPLPLGPLTPRGRRHRQRERGGPTGSPWLT